MDLREASSKKMMARCGKLNHIREAEISMYGSKSRVQWVRKIPLKLMK
jgi:hypothetical protein